MVSFQLMNESTPNLLKLHTVPEGCGVTFQCISLLRLEIESKSRQQFPRPLELLGSKD